MSNKAVIGVLIGLTCVNAAYAGRTKAVDPIRPSTLEEGESLPELRLRGAPCQIVVAFRSDCPFCGAAEGTVRSECDDDLAGRPPEPKLREGLTLL